MSESVLVEVKYPSLTFRQTEAGRDIVCGVRAPNWLEITSDYVRVASRYYPLVSDDDAAGHAEELFLLMQADYLPANLQEFAAARETLLRGIRAAAEAGRIAHTSMSVGDVVVFDRGRFALVVAPVGFLKLPPGTLAAQDEPGSHLQTDRRTC